MVDCIYIMSAGHSGSTLLNLLLGSHSQAVAVSELTYLPANFAFNEMCSCGAAIQACPFWTDVASRMSLRAGHDMHNNSFSLDLGFMGDPKGIYARKLGRLYAMKWKFRRIAIYLSELSGVPLPAFARHRFDAAIRTRLIAYEAIRATSGRPIIIDASKEYLLGISLYRAQPQRTRLLLTVRDGRAVYYSNLKRGLGREYSLNAWKKYYRHAQAIISKSVTVEHRLIVRYEELAAEPEAQLRHICDFAGISFERDMLNPASKLQHMVSGNNMRLLKASAISIDRQWVTALDKNDRSYFEKHAGALNRQLGYE